MYCILDISDNITYLMHPSEVFVSLDSMQNCRAKVILGEKTLKMDASDIAWYRRVDKTLSFMSQNFYL